MHENKFSHWRPWRSRNELDDIKFPGVYAIARSAGDITKKPYSWRKEIVYVGMTVSAGGLIGRLRQFENTIAGQTGHGGAERFRFKHPNYKALVKQLYVSVAPFRIESKSLTPSNLRKKGDIARFEYICLAQYLEVFGELPEFNDAKRSPKHDK